MLKSILSVILFLTISSSFAQLTLQQKLQSDLKLNEQFSVLLLQSRSQDVDFKIIRKSNIEIIQRNVEDSIAKYTKEIADLKKNSSSSVNDVKNLKDSLTAVTAALDVETKKTDSISFLGIDFSKGSYHTIVWSIIIVLALAFLGTLASYRKSKIDTDEHRKSVDQLQEELQILRKKSIEKEQQLKRQLLDEQLKRNS